MMSKMNVEFDTKDKILNVVMDGKNIENVRSVEFFQGYDDDRFGGSITTVEKIDDDDYVKIMRISAKDGLVETSESSNLPKLLGNKLFSKRMV